METIIYNQKGGEEGKIILPKKVFGLSWNSDLVHQVITSLRTNIRKPFAHTKDRGEVRGGGKKPWQQKGTGRARHGSIRSPLWVGGGVTHGPIKEKNFCRKINRKMKAKALYTILSRKFKDGEVLFVDNFSIETPKTKDAKNILVNLSKIKGFEMLLIKKNNSAIIALGEKNKTIEKSFGNLSNIMINETRNLNPLDLLNYKYLVITKPNESVKFISSKLDTMSENLEASKSKIKTKIIEKKIIKKERVKKVGKVDAVIK